MPLYISPSRNVTLLNYRPDYTILDTKQALPITLFLTHSLTHSELHYMQAHNYVYSNLLINI